MSRKYIIYFIVLFFSFVSPIFCFLCIIYFLFDRTNELYPVFLGVLVYHLSLMFNPTETYDYFRHLERLRSDMSYNKIILYYVIHSQSAFIFPLISKFLVVLSFSPKTALAIISGFSTFISAHTSEKYNINNRLISRAIVCFGLSYISILSGMRYMLALSFLIYSFYLRDKNKFISYFFLILSILTHVSLIIALPILFFNKKKFKITAFICFFGLIISPFILDIIFKFLSFLSFLKPINNYVDAYINEVASFQRNFLWSILKFSIVFIFVKKLFNLYLDKTFLYLSFIIITFLNFPIILDRFILLGILLGIFPNLNTFLKKDQLLILFLLFIRFTIEFYDNLEVYLHSFINSSLILNI